MSMKLLEKRREVAAKKATARHLIDLVEERGEFIDNERADYDQLITDIEQLTADIRRLEAAAELRSDDQLVAGRQPVNEEPGIGMSASELRSYSLTRAIDAAGRARRGEPDAWRNAGLELEASNAVAKKLGAEPNGFFVPFDVAQRARAGAPERRDLLVGTPTAGGYTVDEVLSTSLIELLRNRMVVRQAGATVLTGLVGDLAIPKQTGGATAYWLGEGAAPTESQQAIGQVALTPRTVGAYTDYSRKLMIQSSIDVEAFVRSDLASVLQLAIDLAALHGTGAANEPLGVANTTGIGAPGTGAASLAMVVGLETAVAVDNADVGRLAYITNATVRGTLKQTDIGTDTGIMLWNTMAGATPINGYPAYVTNQVTSNNVFFGNWADLIVGFWTGMDIMVDPYTHSTSGTMRVVALQDVDVAVRHAESFALDATS